MTTRYWNISHRFTNTTALNMLNSQPHPTYPHSKFVFWNLVQVTLAKELNAAPNPWFLSARNLSVVKNTPPRSVKIRTPLRFRLDSAHDISTFFLRFCCFNLLIQNTRLWWPILGCPFSVNFCFVKTLESVSFCSL